MSGERTPSPSMSEGSMPRTGFDGEQFKCICGWRSEFEPEFIAQVKAFNATSSGESK